MTLLTGSAILMLLIGLVFRSSLSPHRSSVREYHQANLVPIGTLAEAGQTLQVKGSLMARASNNRITELFLTIANTSGAIPINLADHPFVIDYRDPDQKIDHLPWTWRFQGKHNGDHRLEVGELLQVRLPLVRSTAINLGVDTPFVLYLIPANGVPLRIQRTTPAQLESIVDLQ
jgi:archaellin